MKVSKSTIRQLKKVARKLELTAGWIWMCVNCDHTARRVHEEKWARHMAIDHVSDTGHSVRMLRLK